MVLVDKGEAGASIGLKTDLHGDDHAVIAGTFRSDSHAPIVYPVALKRDLHSPLSPRLMAFLRSPDAMRIFLGFGYTPAT